MTKWYKSLKSLQHFPEFSIMELIPDHLLQWFSNHSFLAALPFMNYFSTFSPLTFSTWT